MENLAYKRTLLTWIIPCIFINTRGLTQGGQSGGGELSPVVPHLNHWVLSTLKSVPLCSKCAKVLTRATLPSPEPPAWPGPFNHCFVLCKAYLPLIGADFSVTKSSSSRSCPKYSAIPSMNRRSDRQRWMSSRTSFFHRIHHASIEPAAWRIYAGRGSRNENNLMWLTFMIAV